MTVHKCETKKPLGIDVGEAELLMIRKEWACSNTCRVWCNRWSRSLGPPSTCPCASAMSGNGAQSRQQFNRAFATRWLPCAEINATLLPSGWSWRASPILLPFPTCTELCRVHGVFVTQPEQHHVTCGCRKISSNLTAATDIEQSLRAIKGRISRCDVVAHCSSGSGTACFCVAGPGQSCTEDRV